MPAPHGGPPGDVLITVSIAPHPLFKVDGQNLRLELPITLYEAVLGAKVRVPTLDGAVELAIPANTSSGRTFRLKGKGLPGQDDAGDLYVTVRIILPDGKDADLEELMKRWRENKPYDPRTDRLIGSLRVLACPVVQSEKYCRHSARRLRGTRK